MILAVAAIAFTAQLLIPGFTEAFLLESSDVLSRPWILITSMFLHGDILHIFYNMLALVIFGLILETIIGARRFWMLYFGGGIIAGIVATFFYPAALGASGAIFAVLGMLAVLRPRMNVWVMYIPMPMAVAALVWVAIDLVGFIAPSGIANAAHISGLIFGVAAGAALRIKYKSSAPPSHARSSSALTEREFQSWEDRWM